MAFPVFASASFPPAWLWLSRRWTDSFNRGDRLTEKEREWLGAMMCVGCVKTGGWCFCCLSISAILVGGVGIDGGAVWLLAIFAWRHPLVYPVQAACLLKVTDLPRGRETLNGWRAEETPERKLPEAGNPWVISLLLEHYLLFIITKHSISLAQYRWSVNTTHAQVNNDS